MRTMLIASSALALMVAPSCAPDATDDAATQQTAAGDQRDWFDGGHPLEGAPVYTNDGNQVGSVERVRGGVGPDAHRPLTAGSSEPLDVTGLVVETGGFLGIGAREVDIDPGQAQRTTVDGDERIILDMSNAEFERLREYSGDRGAGLRDGGAPDRTWQEDQPRNDGLTDPQRENGAASPTPDQSGAQGQAGIPGQGQASAPAGAQTQDQSAMPGQAADPAGATGDRFSYVHEWVGRPVYSSDGERLGTVWQVRASGAGAGADGGPGGEQAGADQGVTADRPAEVDAIIVRTTPPTGEEPRDVQVDGDQLELRSEDNESRVIVDMTADEFGDLPSQGIGTDDPEADGAEAEDVVPDDDGVVPDDADTDGTEADG